MHPCVFSFPLLFKLINSSTVKSSAANTDNWSSGCYGDEENRSQLCNVSVETITEGFHSWISLLLSVCQSVWLSCINTINATFGPWPHAHAAYLPPLFSKRDSIQFEKVRNTTATLFQMFISCGINSLLWRKLTWSEKEHFSVELKPTCADGLIPTPLSVTLTTANSDIQATGQRESWLTAHFKQGRKGVSGREEASHWVFTGG